MDTVLPSKAFTYLVKLENALLILQVKFNFLFPHRVQTQWVIAAPKLTPTDVTGAELCVGAKRSLMNNLIDF